MLLVPIPVTTPSIQVTETMQIREWVGIVVHTTGINVHHNQIIGYDMYIFKIQASTPIHDLTRLARLDLMVGKPFPHHRNKPNQTTRLRSHISIIHMYITRHLPRCIDAQQKGEESGEKKRKIIEVSFTHDQTKPNQTKPFHGCHVIAWI